MKKLFTLSIGILSINAVCVGQGSADQWKYGSSNPTGTRYADFSPKDYSPAVAVKREKYEAPAKTMGIQPKKKGKLWGFADAHGKWLIQPQWPRSTNFGDNPSTIVYTSTNGNFAGGVIRVIDRDGKYLTGSYYMQGDDCHNEDDGEGHSWNYITAYKKPLKSGDTTNQMFIYNLATMDSILLPKGLEIDRKEFDGLRLCQYHSIRSVQYSTKIFAIIDVYNLKIMADNLEQYDHIDYPMSYFEVNTYIDTYTLNSNRIVVKKNNKYGYINIRGEVVIPLQYDNADWFRNGIADVEKDGVKFKIDVNGKKVE
ncbi:MAG: WG repeat-containing protein [Bacteroidia bacterium]